MPGNMKEKVKGLVRTLLTPKVQTVEGHMDTRRKKLEVMGAKKTGGMFDIIYKKRKEREQTLKEAGY